MSKFQEERYIKIYNALLKASDFNRRLEYASSIIYPDDPDGSIVFSSAGFVKYVERRQANSILHKDRIGQYSSKLAMLLNNIAKSEGKIFIFSTYVTDDGIALIENLLAVNGYSNYVSLTSSKTPEARNKLIKRFNHPSNDDGSDIKIILASKVISEGISFKSIREIHLYEPAWNLSSSDQATGRAIRNNSDIHSFPDYFRRTKWH